jgi:hypothetical protein
MYLENLLALHCRETDKFNRWLLGWLVLVFRWGCRSEHVVWNICPVALECQEGEGVLTIVAANIA